MPPAMMTAPRQPRAARWLRPTTTGRRSAWRIGKARPATGTDCCSAATTPGSPTLLPAPRASCGVNSGACTRLPCGHQPTDPYPAGCDVCRFYLEDLDERKRRLRQLPCGQPAACPILWGTCSHCFRAGHTHGMYDLLFCGHTLERPGRNCLSCEARKDLHDAEAGCT